MYIQLEYNYWNANTVSTRFFWLLWNLSRPFTSNYNLDDGREAMKMTSMASRRSTGWQVEGAKRRMEAWKLVLAHSCWGRRYKPDDLCYAAVCRRMPPWDPTNSYILTLTAGRPQQPLKPSILCRLTDFGLRLISFINDYQGTLSSEPFWGNHPAHCRILEVYLLGGVRPEVGGSQ